MTLHVSELLEQTKLEQANQGKETLTNRVLKYGVEGLAWAVGGFCVGEGIAASEYILEGKDILNIIGSSPNLIIYGLTGAAIGLPVGLVKYYRDRKAGRD
jgi:hypothetical protein|tara:strand:+ start:1115 stop:1414 length:300 start_codon:yes stop_codon:yes gene_type:complete